MQGLGLFSQILDLPAAYAVLDFSQGQGEPDLGTQGTEFTIGKFNEVRPGLYAKFGFKKRIVHMGLDIGAPLSSEVKSFYQGEIYQTYIDGETGGFGPTIITKHTIHQTHIYALYGHLSESSLKLWRVGDLVKTGQILSSLGSKEENGGWNPHVHFQLSLTDPSLSPMQGVVAEEDSRTALEFYLDPQLVLGKLY